MTMIKAVANWRIQIFLDTDKAELIKTNDIIEDGVVVTRTPHQVLDCKASDLQVLNQLIGEIETAFAAKEGEAP